MRYAILIFTLTIAFYSESVKAQFAGGSGTENDPYQIETIEQLQNIEDYLDKYFVQIADIDASATETWNDSLGFKPIGDEAEFTGYYDGQEYEIQNLTIKREDATWIGLFKITNNALIENIRLTNVDISGQGEVGGLVGKNNGTDINNCHVTGTISGGSRTGALIGYNLEGDINNSHGNADISGGGSAGGLVGHNWQGKITRSSAKGNVSVTHRFAGGLVGHNSTGEIIDSYATGDVKGDSYLGGLVGTNPWSDISNSYAEGAVEGNKVVGGLTGLNSECIIEESHASGEVTGKNKVGGLVGWYSGDDSTAHIINSYAEGQVSGTNKIGGLIGSATGSKAEVSKSFATGTVSGSGEYAGGLVGYNSGTEIKNSYSHGMIAGENKVGGFVGVNDNNGVIASAYATGEVTGNQDVGGLVGVNGATIQTSYWAIDSTGQNMGIGIGKTDGATGLSSEEMIGVAAKSNMSGLTYGTNWGILPADYPRLLWTVPYFDIQQLNSDSPILAGKTLNVEVEIVNNGSFADTQRVRLLDNHGNVIDATQNIVLDTAETTQQTLQWQSSEGDEGKYSFTIQTDNDVDTLTFAVGELPFKVVQDSPEDTQDYVSLLPMFSWEETALADTYQLQVSTTSDFASTLVNESNLDTLAFSIADSLDYASTYYWRVRGSNDNGSGEWSDTLSFSTIIEEPEVVQLSHPPNEATGINITPELQWNSLERAETYHLQLSRARDFATIVIDTAGLDTLSYGISNNLNYSTTYYWRVRGINNIDSTGWSDTLSFTTKIEKPEVVQLSSPPDEATDIDITPDLQWNSAERAEIYHVQLSSNSQFENPILDISNIDTTRFPVTQELAGNKTYYWRVSASNESGQSGWSNTLSFTTEALTGIVDNDQPDEFELKQNYPNPFNPYTKISYSIPKTTEVILEVYSTLGQRVEVLVNKKQSPGKYQVTFDGGSLSSGTYIYSLQTDGYTETRKMMLVK